MTVEWPGVSRDGEPELVRGPQSGSMKLQNQYRIRTTPAPDVAAGVDWLGFFNSRLSHSTRFSGYHDGSMVIVECWPDDEPGLTETVDAAIEYANEQLRALGG